MSPKFRTGFTGLTLVLIFGFMMIPINNVAYAETVSSGVDWLQGQPTIKKIGPAPAVISGNKNCTKTTVDVLRLAQVDLRVATRQETHCMVATSYGSISSDGTVIQPLGYQEAFPIRDHGSGYVIPIPNQPSVLRASSHGFSSGAGLEIYKNFYSSLVSVTTSRGEKYFDLQANTDDTFKRGNGSIRQLNVYGTLAFDSSGRSFVVEDVLSGFIKIDLFTLEAQPFHEVLVRTGGSGLLDAETAVNGDVAVIGYNAPSNWGQKYMTITNTKSCSSAPYYYSYASRVNICPTRDFYNDIKQEIPQLVSIRNIRFVSERTILFDAQYVLDGPRNATYSMTAPGQKARLVDYVAMGDSFASGQGAGNYRAGTDIARNRCHQSPASYPYLLSKTFNTFYSVSCSGATLVNIDGKSDYTSDISQVNNPNKATQSEESMAQTEYMPGYIAQMKFLDSNPEVVTLSVGGNDIHFARIIAQCADPRKTKDSSTCFASYEDRVEVIQNINGRIQRLRNTYKAILEDSPDRRLYVIGYPQIANAEGVCAFNVKMNQTELQGSIDLIRYLNSVIKQAADEAGAYYVDVEDALAGHRLCEGSSGASAMNGATIRFDQGKWMEFTESYHPNKTGHEMLANYIKHQTKTFTAPMPAPNGHETNSIKIDDTIAFLRNTPKENRPIYDVRYDNELPTTPTYRNEPNALLLDGQAQLLKPNYGFEAVLHSKPISLGSYTSDAQGNLQITYAIPESVEAGFHTLHVYGVDIFNKPIDIQKVVYVADSKNDFDGDGILNQDDSCVTMEQSQQDVDGDGIDDNCDPLIGEPPILVQAAREVGSSESSMHLSLAASSAVLGQSYQVDLNQSDSKTNAKLEVLSLASAPSNIASVSPSETRIRSEIVFGLGLLLTGGIYTYVRYLRKSIRITRNR